MEYFESYTPIFKFEKDFRMYSQKIIEHLGKRVRIFGCQFCFGYNLVDMIIIREYNLDYIEMVRKQLIIKSERKDFVEYIVSNTVIDGEIYYIVKYVVKIDRLSVG